MCVFFTPRVLLPAHPGYIMSVGQVYTHTSAGEGQLQLFKKLSQLGKGKIRLQNNSEKSKGKGIKNKSFANL
jgi:hypothetical protein